MELGYYNNLGLYYIDGVQLFLTTPPCCTIVHIGANYAQPNVQWILNEHCSMFMCMQLSSWTWLSHCTFTTESQKNERILKFRIFILKFYSIYWEVAAVDDVALITAAVVIGVVVLIDLIAWRGYCSGWCCSHNCCCSHRCGGPDWSDCLERLLQWMMLLS